MNKTKLKRSVSQLIQIVEKCGGPGSGVPGPCSSGHKGDNPLSKLRVDEQQRAEARRDKDKQLALLLKQRHNPNPEEMQKLRNELDAKLKASCERARPFRAEQLKNLEAILDEGLKNQFETGTTRGSTNLEYRIKQESKVVGVDPDTKPEDRPKYGYLSEREPDEGGNHSSGSYYGDTIIEFHSDIKKKSTITGQDSFDTVPVVASPCTKPSIDSLGAAAFGYNDDEKTNRMPGMVNGVDRTPYSYVELQMHGKITVKDIKAVYLPGVSGRVYNQNAEFVERHRRIIRRLKEAGIEVRFNGGQAEYNDKIVKEAA